MFLPGINWGLPSRAADPYLFGDEPVWSGRRIMELTGDGRENAQTGADVDLNPMPQSDGPLPLNQTDRQRAEIIRRYRLFSYQPDEWNTMRSLAGMRPGQGKLDPRLYQYGGLWVYPVGAMLKIASICHLIDLRSDLTWYLDHPEAFGRFYVVARLYAALWGLVGVAAVFWIMRRIVGGLWIPAAATFCCLSMPVVVNMAHEAKPHLPGAVLMLLAVIAAIRYVETGRRAWALTAGATCGAAFGMVLSTWPIFLILPVMLLRPPRRWPIDLLWAGVLGLIVYAATNPYVPINAVCNREVLRSNLGASTAMYQAGRWHEGLTNSVRLVAEGASWPLAVAGVIGALALAASAVRSRRGTPDESHARSATSWLLAVPAAMICIQFLSIGAGKPGEYGRFFLFPDITLALAAFAGIARWVRRPAWRGGIVVSLMLLTALAGGRYLAGFIRDSIAPTPRMLEAQCLRELARHGGQTLATYAEPAPYCLPPVDLFHWQLWLLPRAASPAALPTLSPDVVVRALDVAPSAASAVLPGYRRLPQQGFGFPHRFPTRISWAAKPFEIVVREETRVPKPE